MNPDIVVFHMHETVGDFARLLGWKPEAGSYSVPLKRVRDAMGEAIEDVEADRIALLLAVAEAEVWRHAMSVTASYHSLSTADGERRERRQIHENVREMYRLAQSKVDHLNGNYAVRVSDLPVRSDPYNRITSSQPRVGWNWWDR